MAEIMLAPGRDDLVVTKKLLEVRSADIYGVKILINDTYRFISQYDNRYGRYGAVACVLRQDGARKVMIDAKTPNDSKDEMGDVTKSIVAGYTPPKVVSKQKKERPDFQTAHFIAPRKSLEVFVEETTNRGIIPVCFTSSSRYTEQDFEDIGTTSGGFIEKSTRTVTDLGFTAVMCAACDAEAIKNINPNLFIFATGGLLLPDEKTDHERTAILEEVKDFVDVFILGSPILEVDNTLDAFDMRKLAIS